MSKADGQPPERISMHAERSVRSLAAVAIIGLLMGLIAAGSAAAAPNGASERGAGHYIVVLHDSVDSPRAVAQEHARTQGAQVRFVYEHALKGYAATLSEDGLRGVQRDPRVDYVERDGVATIVHHQCGHDKPRPYEGECETGTISGAVTDSSTNEGIENASVSADGKTVTTGTDGMYTIANVSTGAQEVTASAKGYDSLTQTVTVVTDTTVTADFALKASTSEDPSTSCDSQTLPWGIERVGAHQSSTTAGDCTGEISNVHVYVIDTGADADHTDLNVVNHVNFAGGPNKDCHGHGTHVAGTIAAIDNNQDVVGVAPGAAITGVKVLGCSGSGSWSGVIAGIDFVTNDAKTSGWPAIANMSLGGGANKSVDDAVRNSAAEGVVYSIAAGNSGADACNYSPARAGAGTNNGIITVAATDKADEETSWSNYGTCVDIWAPGLSILSTSKGGGTTTMSGTSMAAPHVGGAAALYLATHTTASATAVETALIEAAVADANGDGKGTTSKDGAPIMVLNVSTF
jgi:aqualysin 1